MHTFCRLYIFRTYLKNTFLNNIEVGTKGLLKNKFPEDNPRRRVMFAVLVFQSREKSDYDLGDKDEINLK